MLKVTSSIVSADWLYQHFEDENLVILDASIPKVTNKDNSTSKHKEFIKNAIFFDIKNEFSDKNSKFPNTVLSPVEFEKRVQSLGINTSSCLIVYDNLGLYSSARVWWMFQLMGFKNIAVLDGGLPAWKAKNYPVKDFSSTTHTDGNFTANFTANKLAFTTDVLENLNSNNFLVVDARSEGRFFAREPEPRKELKGGHIPKSKNLPYTKVLKENFIKSTDDLRVILNEINPKNKPIIFSCGSGITASILALAANIIGKKDCAVYDGSWTEWGSTPNLPINT
ncbi:MAG: sulfurtransferase [Flavobacteriaceae bacterium]|nr:sulfurtransferase [Flavobacteriaceae bacterium]